MSNNIYKKILLLSLFKKKLKDKIEQLKKQQVPYAFNISKHISQEFEIRELIKKYNELNNYI